MWDIFYTNMFEKHSGVNDNYDLFLFERIWFDNAVQNNKDVG